MEARLAGKNVLDHRCAAQGMGAAIAAVHFAAQGANVCLGDLDEDLAVKNVADRHQHQWQR